MIEAEKERNAALVEERKREILSLMDPSHDLWEMKQELKEKDEMIKDLRRLLDSK